MIDRIAEYPYYQKMRIRRRRQSMVYVSCIVIILTIVGLDLLSSHRGGELATTRRSYTPSSKSVKQALTKDIHDATKNSSEEAFDEGIHDSTISNTEYAPEELKGDSGISSDVILELVNIERSKVGVAPLKADPKLTSSAQWKADDMHINGYFSHSAKNTTSGVNGLDFLKTLEVNCSLMAENINRIKGPSRYITSELTVTSWVNSSSHYKTMVDPRYTLTGVGIAGGNPAYQVQHFCAGR